MSKHHDDHHDPYHGDQHDHHHEEHHDEKQDSSKYCAAYKDDFHQRWCFNSYELSNRLEQGHVYHQPPVINCLFLQSLVVCTVLWRQ